MSLFSVTFLGVEGKNSVFEVVVDVPPLLVADDRLLADLVFNL